VEWTHLTYNRHTWWNLEKKEIKRNCVSIHQDLEERTYTSMQDFDFYTVHWLVSLYAVCKMFKKQNSVHYAPSVFNKLNAHEMGGDRLSIGGKDPSILMVELS
jgi:hypothetical protein